MIEDVARVQQTYERIYEAGLHRVNSDLLLGRHRNGDASAESCYRIAINIACGQGARSLEPRATMSLGRLLARRPNRQSAPEAC